MDSRSESSIFRTRLLRVRFDVVRAAVEVVQVLADFLRAAVGLVHAPAGFVQIPVHHLQASAKERSIER